jgi:hypothetical protein
LTAIEWRQEIRNPNIEARNKFKTQKQEYQNELDSGLRRNDNLVLSPRRKDANLTTDFADCAACGFTRIGLKD